MARRKRHIGPTARANLGALAVYSLSRPLALGLLVGVEGASAALGQPVLGLIPAVGLWLTSAALTATDPDEQDKVFADVAAERRSAPVQAAPAPRPLPRASEIARHVVAARERRARIAATLTETGGDAALIGDVDAFVSAVEETARRAQLLHGAKHDTPLAEVELRLQRARERQEPALVEALAQQAEVLRRMDRQLARFDAEMERMVVELDTIRVSLLSAAASEHTETQRRVAGELRALRENATTLADAMRETYELAPGT